jgi:hypothetical protein
MLTRSVKVREVKAWLIIEIELSKLIARPSSSTVHVVNRSCSVLWKVRPSTFKNKVRSRLNFCFFELNYPTANKGTLMYAL